MKRMTSTNGRATTTTKRDLAGQVGYLASKYDVSGDAETLPDLTDAGEQDKALALLIDAQGDHSLTEARIFAAIHNTLYDLWTPPQQQRKERKA